MTRSHLILCIVWVCVSVCMCKLEMHGHVRSPLYPKPYPANVRKQWNLEVPAGYQIQVTFNYLDIEPSPNCYYDSLMVLHDRKLLNKFCGQNSSDPHHPGHKTIISPSNSLQLVFITDQTNTKIHQHLGFSVFYQAVDIDECTTTDSENSNSRCSQICINTLGSYLCACHYGYQLYDDYHTCVLDCGGGVFKEPQGVISSPGFPNTAPFKMKCIYSISVQPGFQIILSFNDSFHIEYIPNREPSCLYHWLQISVPGQSPRKLCGDESPGVINTHSHIVELEFHTDDVEQSRGFSLQYTSHRVECELNQTICNGQISPNFPKYFYRDYIHIRCDTGYKLMTEGNVIKSYVSMCTEDGTWHLPLPQCKIIDCGDPRPPPNVAVKVLSGFKYQYKTLIQFYCIDPYYTFQQAYEDFTCGVDGDWISRNGQTFSQNFTQCVPVCGLNKKIYSHGRIFGGERASLGEIPWQLLFKGPGRGGATLINDRWALTAALIVKNKKEMVFYGGMVDALDRNMVQMETEKIIIHPDYKNDDYKNFDNDIALVKMKTRVPLSDNLSPVCLPEKKTNGPAMENKQGTVSGFGGTEEFRMISRYLNYGHVEEYSESPCFETDLNVTDNMFCAGDIDAHVDSCKGDSGGPLVIPMLGTGSKAQPYRLKGIVSWGPSICGNKNYKSYYTKVENYLDWIRDTMEAHDE